MREALLVVLIISGGPSKEIHFPFLPQCEQVSKTPEGGSLAWLAATLEVPPLLYKLLPSPAWHAGWIDTLVML